MNSKVLNSEFKAGRESNFSRMKKTIVTAVLIMAVFGLTANATDFTVDKSASKVKWEAKKVTGKHNGSIFFENGSVSVNDNKITGGSFAINMKSMVNEDISDAGMKQKLMGHLASDDFFSVAKFPESMLVIKKVTPVSGDEYHFVGDLTIKGITNPAEFNAKVSVNGDKLNADGVLTVNRTLYDIKYGSGKFFEGLGDKMIYDDFTLAFTIVALKK